MRVYETAKLSDPINLMYRKAYKTHNARIRTGKITKNEFTELGIKARDMLSKASNGEIGQGEFEEWLKI